MDKHTKDKIFQAFPRENTAYKINRNKMSMIMEDCWQRAYFSAFDDVISAIKDPELTDKDLLLGELHLLIMEKLRTVKGTNAYICASLGNLDWLISYTAKGKEIYESRI